MGGEPGWWADPHVHGQLRYWDGQRWTEHTRPAPPWPEEPGRAAALGFPPAPALPPPDVATINRQSLLILVAGLVAVLLIVGVGVGFARRSGEPLTAASGATSTIAPRAGAPTTSPPRAGSVAGKPCVAASADVPEAKGKPLVEMPVGDPPTELLIDDLRVGEGPSVRRSDMVTVQYVGISCSTGRQFDASWDMGGAVTFSLDGVIPGWSEGLVGMKVGGRRRLVIPPDLAYGDVQKGAEIAPGETLVFVIDLFGIEDGAAGPGGTTTGPAATFPATSSTVCPAADGSAKRRTSFAGAPPACIDPARRYTATFVTDKGEIVIDLDPKAAPVTVNNFVVLARYHFYDGVPFHRVLRGFMAQSGDATGEPKGVGGPGYRFEDELPTTPYRPGDLAMANSGPDTNGSQFFIYVGPNPLDLQYTRFGHVRAGLDTTVAAIIDGGADEDGAPMTNPTTITTVTITEE